MLFECYAAYNENALKFHAAGCWDGVTQIPVTTILLIIEHGGLPIYPRDLAQMGYEVETVYSQRKALSALKKKVPDVVVAEFNFVSTFRDRISNLESLLARLQTNAPDTKVIVIYEQEHEEHLTRIKQRFAIHAHLRYPVTVEHFMDVLQQTIKV